MVAHRMRGRPRTKINQPDLGTPEMQQKRLILLKNFQPTPAANESLPALGGSRLHTLYMKGWLNDDMLEATLWYARLMNQAFRSKGIPLQLRSQLIPPHERNSGIPYESGSIERLWRKITGRLSATCQQLLHRLVIVSNATWPTFAETHIAMQELVELYRAPMDC